MTILFINHIADLYGSSRSLLRLTSALVRDGDQVYVVLQEAGPLKGALESAGIKVIIMPELPTLHRSRLRSPSGLIRLLSDSMVARRSMLALMNRLQPDLVHTNSATVFPVAGMCARRLNIPHIHHTRELFHEFGIVWRMYRKLLQRYSDRILCNSEAVARQFPASSEVFRLYNAYPVAECQAVTEEEIRGFLRRYKLGGNLLVGVIGRIKLKRKGQETFVEAAAILRNEFPSVKYLIIGAPFPGNESHLIQIRDRIRQLGLEQYVELTGEIENPQVAYAALDIVVMASGTPEPFGLVTIEAMAAGKPVVGTAIGGTPEIIEDHQTGLLIPPNDPEAMAKALGELLRDPARREEMGRQARRRFLERFEFDSFYRALRQHYREVREIVGSRPPVSV